MSINAIYEAVDAQLLTFSGSFPGQIGTMNVTIVPKGGIPYLVATMAAYTRRALTLGTDKTIAGGGYLAEHRGTYRIEAVVPQDSGLIAATRLQTHLLSLFKRGTTLTSSAGDHVNFDAPTPLPIVGNEGWYRAPVNCPWWVYEAS